MLNSSVVAIGVHNRLTDAQIANWRGLQNFGLALVPRYGVSSGPACRCPRGYWCEQIGSHKLPNTLPTNDAETISGWIRSFGYLDIAPMIDLEQSGLCAVVVDVSDPTALSEFIAKAGDTNTVRSVHRASKDASPQLVMFFRKGDNFGGPQMRPPSVRIVTAGTFEAPAASAPAAKAHVKDSTTQCEWIGENLGRSIDPLPDRWKRELLRRSELAAKDAKVTSERVAAKAPAKPKRLIRIIDDARVQAGNSHLELRRDSVISDADTIALIEKAGGVHYVDVTPAEAPAAVRLRDHFSIMVGPSLLHFHPHSIIRDRETIELLAANGASFEPYAF